MAWAYQGRGTALMSQNQLEAASADFGRALELNPTLVNSYTSRGLVLLLQGKDAEAAKDFGRGLELKPGIKAELEERIKWAKKLLEEKH